MLIELIIEKLGAVIFAHQGAFYGLMVGLITGVTRLILIFVYQPPAYCGDPDTRPSFIKDFQYMYFAMLLFWLTGIVTVVVSLFTEKPAAHLVSYFIYMFEV